MLHYFGPLNLPLIFNLNFTCSHIVSIHLSKNIEITHKLNNNNNNKERKRKNKTKQNKTEQNGDSQDNSKDKVGAFLQDFLI